MWQKIEVILCAYPCDFIFAFRLRVRPKFKDHQKVMSVEIHYNNSYTDLYVRIREDLYSRKKKSKKVQMMTLKWMMDYCFRFIWLNIKKIIYSVVSRSLYRSYVSLCYLKEKKTFFLINTRKNFVSADFQKLIPAKICTLNALSVNDVYTRNDTWSLRGQLQTQWKLWKIFKIFV